MAATSGQVTVSTTAVALNSDTDTTAGTIVWLRNTDATNGVALGGSGVTAATGFRVAAGVTVGPIVASGGEVLYAIRTGAADVVVDVLRVDS